MGGVISAIGGGIGSIVDAFSGDTPKQQTNDTSSSVQESKRTLGPMGTGSEVGEKTAINQFNTLGDLLNGLTNGSVQNSDAVNNLFKQALTTFATGSGNPSPDQLKSATDYVDQTFSAPAQTSYNRFLDQAQNAIASRAAQLGRSSSDVGYQREFASQASNAAQDLSNQRGSLIAQRADYLTNQLPQNQLSSLLNGAQYFNTPLNQALQNRLSLLNASTAQQNIGLNQSIASGSNVVKTSGKGNNTMFIDPTMGGRIAGGVQGGGSIVQGIGQGIEQLYSGGALGG